MRTRGFLARPHVVGDTVYIITGDTTSQRCRLTEDHGGGEYSWVPSPATSDEMWRLIEQLEAEGKLPFSAANP